MSTGPDPGPASQIPQQGIAALDLEPRPEHHRQRSEDRRKRRKERSKRRSEDYDRRDDGRSSKPYKEFWRRAKSTPMVGTLLEHCLDWDFDVFGFGKLPETQQAPLFLVGNYLIDKFVCPLIQQLDMSKVRNWLWRLNRHMKPNPYHNSIHVCDVALASCNLLSTSFFRRIGLTELDVLAVIIAALIHDLGHDGRTNAYHVEVASRLAVRYNDLSVLENYHIATAWELMQEPGCNWLGDLDRAAQKYVRKVLIRMVLSTDMGKHNGLVDKLVQRAEHYRKAAQCQVQGASSTVAPQTVKHYDVTEDDKIFFLEMLLHTADISNPTKPFGLAKRWAKKLSEEWFIQGDDERQRKLSPLPHMDRSKKPSIPKGQLFFSSTFIKPLLDAWKPIVPEIESLREQVVSNVMKWKKIDSKETAAAQAAAADGTR